jgi:hypothetical protein
MNMYMHVPLQNFDPYVRALTSTAIIIKTIASWQWCDYSISSTILSNVLPQLVLLLLPDASGVFGTVAVVISVLLLVLLVPLC